MTLAVSLWACSSGPAVTPIGKNLRFTTVAVGGLHACGLAANGNTYCWGENSAGQLGAGTLEYQSGMVRVTGTQRFTSLGLRGERSCGVTVPGELFCWGANPTARVTPGLKAYQDTRRSAPVRVADSLTLAAVAVGAISAGSPPAAESTVGAMVAVGSSVRALGTTATRRRRCRSRIPWSRSRRAPTSLAASTPPGKPGAGASMGTDSWARELRGRSSAPGR